MLLQQMLPRVVCPSYVCMCVHLSHLHTLLKPLDGMICHLAETLVWGDLGVRTPSSQQCCLLLNYFGPCYYYY